MDSPVYLRILSASTPWDIAIIPLKDLQEYSFYIWHLPNVSKQELYGFAKVLAFFKHLMNREDFTIFLNSICENTNFLSSVNAFTEEEMKVFEAIFDNFFCAFLAQKN